MCVKKLYPPHHVKYLGVYLDGYLNCVTHVNQLCMKIVKTNVMLSKIRYFVNKTTLQSIYFAVFNSHSSYACTAWGQPTVPSHRACILQKTALRMICFAKFNDHTTSIISQNENYKIY